MHKLYAYSTFLVLHFYFVFKQLRLKWRETTCIPRVGSERLWSLLALKRAGFSSANVQSDVLSPRSDEFTRAHQGNWDCPNREFPGILKASDLSKKLCKILTKYDKIRLIWFCNLYHKSTQMYWSFAYATGTAGQALPHYRYCIQWFSLRIVSHRCLRYYVSTCSLYWCLICSRGRPIGLTRRNFFRLLHGSPIILVLWVSNIFAKFRQGEKQLTSAGANTSGV